MTKVNISHFEKMFLSIVPNYKINWNKPVEVKVGKQKGQKIQLGFAKRSVIHKSYQITITTDNLGNDTVKVSISMDILLQTLILFFGAMVLGLILLLIINQIHYKKESQELTDKLLSKL